MEELLNPVQEETVEVVDIQFRPGQKIYFFDPDGMTFQTGDHVVMDTARGAEFGICAGGNHAISTRDVVAPLRKILRKANAQDEKINAENRSREKRAFDICMQKIEHHGLDMQLVSAECAFDGSKILFYFTADERVDFRELVKDLAGVFHTRIELRQIGVRDKAKMVGGLGICGRPFCCASFLDDFQPVSIKMAKTQNLSLNPTKISGTCGRLMCCLKYEQDTYESLIRTSPKAESFVDTPDGRGTVVEVDILRQRVKVRMEENPETVGVYANEDIAVLRSGKARKNDPPIPADLAPISGSGKRPRKQQEEDAPILESIRFRYSTETIAEASVAPAEGEAPQEAEEQKPARSRRRRGSRPEAAPKGQEQKQDEKPEKPEKPEKQGQKSQGAEEKQEQQRRPRREQRSRGQKPQRGEAREENAQRPEKQQAAKSETGEQKNRGQSRPPKKQQPQQQSPDAGQTAAPADGEAKKPRRRPNNHRPRRPRSGQSGSNAGE